MSKFLRHIFLPVLMLLAAASCHRRPLYDAEELVKIQVKVNIEAIANVTSDIYNDKIPVPDLTTDMMRVMVYEPGTKRLLSQSFISNKTYSPEGNQILSGNLNISFGNYDFVVYNFDTPTTQVKEETSENTIIAYTDEISQSLRTKYLGTKADEYDDISINYEPDHLTVAREKDVYVAPHDTVVVINTTARTIVDTYYIQIHVEGMQHASSATAVISGLSPSNRFGLNERTVDPSAAVCFDLHKSTDPNLPGANKDVLCAVFNTFGKIQDISSNLHVTFNVVDTAGNLQQKDINLDTVFNSEDAIERHWLLIDETWVIDDPTGPVTPPASNGGFQPKVDDWVEEQGEISL